MTTEREKIISLTKECGMVVSTGGNGYWDHVDQMEAFYKLAKAEAFEAAALACDDLVSKLHGVTGLKSVYGMTIREMAKEMK